jgi:hypothetical protein
VGKRNRKNKPFKSINPSANSDLSINECIEIQAEAYYRAIKRIEAEHASCPAKPNPTWKERFSIAFAVFLSPKSLVKRKNNLADSLLNVIVSTTLDAIGFFLRAIAVASLLFGLFNLPENKILYFFYIIIDLGLIMAGGMFRAASMEIELERDNDKLYAYSASLMATLAVLISIIALLKSLLK